MVLIITVVRQIPKQDTRFRIRFRTKRNNVDMVYLVYDGKRQQMERVAKSNGFDYL